jgi:hypothetical protein
MRTRAGKTPCRDQEICGCQIRPLHQVGPKQLDFLFLRGSCPRLKKHESSEPMKINEKGSLRPRPRCFPVAAWCSLAVGHHSLLGALRAEVAEKLS